MQKNNYALVDHMRTLTDFKSDTTIITDLNSISIRNTCEYGIIVLPLSVDPSKKIEANAFIKMAQFYNNLKQIHTLTVELLIVSFIVMRH